MLAHVLGDRIRFYRSLANMTQELLAQELGVSKQYVGQLERGSRNPSLPLFEKICGILDILPINLFFDGTSSGPERHIRSGGVWLIDFQAGKEVWSESLCRLLGYHALKPEASLSTFLRHVSTADKSHFLQFHTQLLDGSPPRPMSLDMIRKRGATIRVRVQAEVFLGEHDHPLHAVLCFQDITEWQGLHGQLLQSREQLERVVEEKTRKLAAELALREEAEVRAQEKTEQMERLVHAVPAILYSFVPGIGGTAIWSPHVERILGYSERELISDPMLWNRSIHPEDADKVEKAIRSGMQGTPINIEYRIRTKNGQWRWLHDQARLTQAVPHGGELIGVAMDVTERKRLEAELRHRQDELLQHSEARFHNLLENVHNVAVQGYAEDGTTVYWNRASEMFYGYSAQEALGRNLVDLIIPENLNEAVLAAIEHMVQTGTAPPAGEVTLRRKDGSPIHLLSSHAVVSKSDGSREFFCIDVDLTGRKRAEGEAREREEHYRALVAGLPDYVMRFDREGRHLFVSDNVSDVVDFQPGDFLGRTHREMGFPEERARFWDQAIHGVFATGQGFETDFQFETKHGPAVHNWRLVPEFDHQGRVRTVLSISRDITEQRRVEQRNRELYQKARESEERYRALFEKSSEGVFLHDLKGRIINANQAAQDMYGYTLDELRTLHPRQLTHPDDPDVMGQLFQGVCQQHIVTGEHRCRRKDGTYFDVQVRDRLVNDNLVQSVVRDITAERNQKQALIQAKEAAEAADRAKSEFLNNLSHELRTPLNGVVGVMHLLQDAPLDEEARQFVDMALKSSQRLAHLLSELLDLTRIESGNMVIHSAPFQVDDLCNSLAELFSMAIQEKGLDSRCVVDPSLPAILIGDLARLRQVLFNLVGNAIKFTDAGSVLLEISAVSRGREGFLHVLFSVIDTGIGIPDDQVERIFQPFVKPDGSFHRRHGGTGLGLTIAQRLVHLMRGSLAVESEPGQGTAVHFSLPLRTLNTGYEG
ncbi:PAS domain S-box protein [Desulfonatronum parangueonense]